MKSEERRQKIIEVLIQEESASLEFLAQRFAVSTMTIHRDLDELETEGLLRKQRGGATIESSGQFESDFRFRLRKATDEKRRIARRAVEFIQPGMSVMIDDGSTSQNLILFLIEKRPLTVITNNLSIITELGGRAGITLLALGGTYSKKFNGFFGIVTEEVLTKLRADIVLLSSSAIEGITAFHQDQEVVQVKRKMIAASTRRYLMVDHQKFGHTALHLFTKLDVFDGVITTDALAKDKVNMLRDAGVTLHFAGKD